MDGPPVHDAVHDLGVLQERARQQLLEVNLQVEKRCQQTELSDKNQNGATERINFRA